VVRLLGLTAEEWVVLASAIVPVIVAVLVVWGFWRWAKRDEAAERDANERGPRA
jgi:hypothetical protein